MASFSQAACRATLLLAVLAPVTAVAAEIKAGDLVIGQPWVRATPKGAEVAGGYLTVTNRGSAPDVLVGGTFEGATGFALHDMTIGNGVMRMRPAGPVALPPGGSVTLSPAGLHIMLTGLRRGLKQGDSVDGTLIFKRNGTVPVRFNVEGNGAMQATEPRH